jgi:hypothetical protein
MLAIGRILRTGATLLLLDEPTEGLAPVIVQQIGAVMTPQWCGRLKPFGSGLLSLVARPAGWAVGFGMGYRRGVNDAKLGDIIKAGHRVNAE